jgi:hypothetical protein
MEVVDPIGNESRVNGKPLWDCREVAASDLAGYENAIWDIYRRKYDCLIVRGTLPVEVCDKIIAGAATLPGAEKSVVPGGWTFPPIFYTLADALAHADSSTRRKILGDYFQRCLHLSEQDEALLGIDIDGLTNAMLLHFSGNCNVAVPKGYKDQGIYAGSTLRAYQGKGLGFTSLQCGNYFQTVSQHFYEHLEEQVDVFDQLGFFFMLQTAEQGGALSLFDLEWEEGQFKTEIEDPSKLILPDKTERTVFPEQAQTLRPQKGDWVIYAAGQIWHRLEPVLGSRERLTLGGFAAYSYDKKTIYHWS